MSPAPGSKAVTLTRHIMEQERKHPHATGEFSNLLSDIMLAAKIINAEVTRAGLLDILGLAGNRNASGDKVQKLDVFAHETITKILCRTGELCVMASEEDQDIIPIPDNHPCGKYVLNFDPLDGSSNINANVNIGTIFSIHRRISDGGRGTKRDVLQSGSRQVCAGYILYGTSTMLVYTTGNGVHGFTYEPSVGEFLLSHEDIQTPLRGRIYSANEGNYEKWEPGVRRYIDHLKQEDQDTHRPYSLRYVGSLVADFHRNLLYGGIFLYPGDRKNPSGKLRVLYEAAPLAMIATHAGGLATDGKRSILEIEPTQLHERTPLVIGSREDVLEAGRFIAQG